MLKSNECFCISRVSYAMGFYFIYLFFIIQVSQLGAAAQKYQAFTQNATPNLSVPELQNNCNM